MGQQGSGVSGNSPTGHGWKDRQSCKAGIRRKQQHSKGVQADMSTLKGFLNAQLHWLDPLSNENSLHRN